MELEQPETIAQNPVAEFQNPGSKRLRFFRHSNADHFYLENFDGGLRMPNEFCAVKDGELNDQYFILKRDGEKFKAYSVTVSKYTFGISIYLFEGDIWQYWELINQHTKNAEFLEVKPFLKNLNERISQLFTNFSITI